jgi:tRNA (guanosine-2'-O-)-methyltransferase
MVTERRKARIASVVASRTNSIALLLENVHNEANECAVTRSMDALGCQHLHKLQTVPSEYHALKKHRFPPRTDSGARDWVEIHQWDNTRECISHLKDCGYIVASACPAATTPISDIDFSRQKVLVAFGNERDGISDELKGISDVTFSLPMCGFVSSYNISVSVALTLYHAYLRRLERYVSKDKLPVCTNWRSPVDTC